MEQQQQNTSPNVSPWLTVKEAAARAKCGPKVIYKAARNGKLKATAIDGQRVLRMHIANFDQWLDGQEGGAA
jgi:excisionase family DNA binding protein